MAVYLKTIEYMEEFISLHWFKNTTLVICLDFLFRSIDLFVLSSIYTLC